MYYGLLEVHPVIIVMFEMMPELHELQRTTGTHSTIDIGS